MRKGEVTRQRIIEQAAPIFNQKGFAGASLTELMAATGLEKGGIYRHFSSKEELAAEALRYALQQSLPRFGELETIQGSIETLQHLVARFAETSSQVPGGCPLMNTAVDADDGNPTLRDLALDGLRGWQTQLHRIISRGISVGEIEPHTDPVRVANAIIAMLEGALMMSRLERTRRPLEDARKTLNTLLQSIAAI